MLSANYVDSFLSSCQNLPPPLPHTHTPRTHTHTHTHTHTTHTDEEVGTGEVVGDDEEEAWLEALESGDVDERGYLPAKKTSTLTARQVCMLSFCMYNCLQN